MNRRIARSVRSVLSACAVISLLLLSGEAASAHLFSFRPPAGARMVSVAGTFNQWSVTAHPLRDDDGDGVWTADVPVPPGRHLYKFVVNGIDWYPDPTATLEDDGMGGQNSVLADGSAGGPIAASGTSTCLNCVLHCPPGAQAATRPATPRSTPPAPAGQATTTMTSPATPTAAPGMTVFTYRAPAGTRSVAVAGSFNNWSTTANMMTAGADGTFTTSIRLAPGSYQYKFVLNGSDWREDPANPKKTDDGLGGMNSVIDVTASGGSNTGSAALPTSSTPATPTASPGMTVFTYRAPPGTRSVAVAGSFNNWSTTANMMTAGADGTFTTSIRLAPGSYQYKFVLNGSDWREDPANPKKTDDGLGGMNSVIDVTASGGSNTGSVAGSVPGSAATSAAGVTFSFRAPAGTRSVAVAGTFNNWSPTATMLTDPDGDGVWTTSFRPPAGTHQYKFVINGTDWIADPANPQKADDGFGGQNSVLQISLSPPGGTGGEGAEMVSFAFRSLPGTRSVALAGTFNNWNLNAQMLEDADADGTWTTQLALAPGIHEYKFVINGLEWIRDPVNPLKVPDGSGGENSVLVVGAAARAELAGRYSDLQSNAHSPPAARASEGRDLWAVEPPHRFAFRPAGGGWTGAEAVTTVAVAGSFNNWSTTSSPMEDADGDGEWTTDINLPQGVTRYKFVVNGRTWLKDPSNPRVEPDGFGGQNSLVERGVPAFPDPDSRRGDGLVAAEAIAHGRDARWVVRTAGDEWTLTIRLDRDDVTGVLVASPDHVQRMSLFSMDDRFEYWRTAVRFRPESVVYWFVVEDGDQRWIVDRGGLRTSERESVALWAFELAPGPIFRMPGWLRGAVMYHIFPDRFRNGDPSNDPEGRTRHWRTEPLPKSPEGWEAVYGGDLDGIVEGLDHLAALGVTVVKLNPIFAAPSNSKYDWVDLSRVDGSFGGNVAFERLLEAAKARGIRIILDGVFNHSGDQHPYFRDVAARGPESPYYRWYNILKWPFPDRFEGRGERAPSNFYECWWGFGKLPAWNTRRDEVRAYLLGAAEEWTRKGIGGWRLDAANEVEPEFWRLFRSRVKAIDPDQYLVGEIWEGASDWLQGDQFDATMNYELRGAILDFFVERRIEAPEFAARVGRLSVAVAAPVRSAMYNHLGSHDVKRVMTLAGGERDRARQAAEFLFAMPGVPVIYYGDEVGLEGGDDPDNRRAFPWDAASQDQVLLATYRKLGRLRAEEPVLGASRWIPLHAQGRILVALATEGGDALLQVYNASDEPADVVLSLPPGGPVSVPAGAYVDLLGGGRISIAGDEIVLPRIEPRTTHFYKKVNP